MVRPTSGDAPDAKPGWSTVLRNRAGVVCLALVVLAAIVGVIALVVGHQSKSAVAYFANANSIYPDDGIRILGVPVGKIDKITPDGGRVRVDFHYDSKYDLPANVGASIISPTLVATRYIQLTPVYRGGPVFPDGGAIPEIRTTSPIDFDELKKQLIGLTTALGPNGANSDGSLTRFLNNAAANANGQGQNFHNTLDALSHAIDTISQGRGDLFSTVRNLQVFVHALDMSDNQIAELNQRLSSVSSILAEDRQDFGDVLTNADEAAAEVNDFVGHNRNRINTAVDQSGQVVQSVARMRDDIALILHIGGPLLQNFYNIFSGSSNVPTGALELANLHNPAMFACSGIAEAVAPDVQKAANACTQYLGPLAQRLAVQEPPIGLSPIQRPGGGMPVPNDPRTGINPGPRPQDTHTLPGQSGAKNGDTGPALPLLNPLGGN